MFTHSSLTKAAQTLPRLLAMLVLLNACSIKSTGEVKDDTTLSGETGRLAEAGAEYGGPEYVVGLLKFANKTPSKALGVGEAATTILRTQLQAAGLQAILLDKEEMGEQKRLQEMQESGALKIGKQRADEGFDAIDYRLSGAITAYSEVEEGVDALLYQSKTRVARVTVDYALVDVATGKSLVAESGAGEYRKKTSGALGLGAKSSFDPNLRDGALRDALAKAMNKMIAKLSALPFRGVVLSVEGGDIVIRAGTRSHLGAGTQLQVLRTGEEMLDPETGKSLGTRESKVGTIRLSQHQNERLSEATLLSGPMPKRGDVVTATP